MQERVRAARAARRGLRRPPEQGLLDQADHFLRRLLDRAEGEEMGRGAGGEAVPRGRAPPRAPPPPPAPRAPHALGPQGVESPFHLTLPYRLFAIYISHDNIFLNIKYTTKNIICH